MVNIISNVPMVLTDEEVNLLQLIIKDVNDYNAKEKWDGWELQNVINVELHDKLQTFFEAAYKLNKSE